MLLLWCQGHKSWNCLSRSNASNTREDLGEKKPDYSRKRHQPTCYNCHKVGHYRPQCPELEKNVSSADKSKTPKKEKFNKALAIEDTVEDMMMDDEDANGTAIIRPANSQSLKKNEVMGMVNGFQIPFTIDTGADITADPEELVPEIQLTGDTVNVRSCHGHLRQRKTARLNFSVGGYQLQRIVTVCPGKRLRGVAILAIDIRDDADMVADLFKQIKVRLAGENCTLPDQHHDSSESVSQNVHMVEASSTVGDPNEITVGSMNSPLPDECVDNSSAVDNLPVNKSSSLELVDDNANPALTNTDVSSNCDINSNSTNAGFVQGGNDSIVDGCGDECAERVELVLGVGDRSSDLDEVLHSRVEGRAEGAVDQVQLSVIGQGMKIENLKAFTKAYPTLTTLRGLADRKKQGYRWVGLLMKFTRDVDGESRAQLILPKEFRPRVLTRAHEKCGHFG